MKRKALIIGAPDSAIPGVKADMKNYYAYLTSRTGGLWRADEIDVLENPSRKLTLEKVSMLRYVDYSFVLFGGHGSYSTSDRATKLVVGGREQVFDHELMYGAERRTVIIDACRNIPTPSAVRTLRKIAMDSMAFASAIDPRKVFDAAVMLCPPSLTAIHSCSIDESAGDNERGGTYSRALLDAAYEWNGSASSVLTIDDAHTKAAEWTLRERGGSQHAQCTSGRGTQKFPFAVGD